MVLSDLDDVRGALAFALNEMEPDQLRAVAKAVQNAEFDVLLMARPPTTAEFWDCLGERDEALAALAEALIKHLPRLAPCRAWTRS